MGVFANTLSLTVQGRDTNSQGRRGLAVWLLSRLRRHAIKEPRLVLVEKISLAPRQSVALVEADGQRWLVATSSEGTPVFYPLKPAAGRPRERRGAPASVEDESL